VAITNSVTASSATVASAASALKTTSQKSAAQALISKLGSGSGVDLNSLATNLVDAERAARTAPVNKNITAGEARVSGYAALSMTIDSLKTAFDALQKPSGVNLVSASSSNTSAVSVTATTGAILGTHEVSVTARAQGQRNLSTGFAATDTKVSNSDFYLQVAVNGKTKGVKVAAANATPSGMVTAINNAKLGVTAQLVNTGDGSASPYKIVLNGTTGASNSFSFSTDDGTGKNDRQKITFRTATASGTFKIGDVSVSVKASDTAASIATAAKAALEAADSKNGVVGRTYMVNGDALMIDYTLTDGNMDLVTVTDPQLTRAVTTGQANPERIQAFSLGTPLSAVELPKVQALTFGDASANGTISLGGVSVAVQAGDTASQVAAKVLAAFQDPVNSASLGGKQLTDLGGGILRVSYPFSDGDASLAYADDATPTGVSVSAQTTQVFTRKTSLVDVNFSDLKQQARDTEFTLNGITMRRSSNAVSDAIPGVTLNLLGATVQNSPVLVTINRDTNTVREKVKALVEAFNMTISDLKVLSGPKNTEDPTDIYSGSLQNESTVQVIRTQLRRLVLDNSTSPGTSVKALRDIGVSIDKNGILTFDEAGFDTAATNGFDEIVTMLTANKESKSQFTTLTQGLAGDAVKRLTDLTKPTGYIQTQSSSAQKNVDRYKEQLEQIEARLKRLQEQYTKTFANLDTLVGSISSQRTSLKSTFDAMLKTGSS
jgi:flagellar capping protein FliD